MPVTSFDAAGGRRSAGRAALRRHLAADGVRQVDVARRLRVPASTLCEIASGRRLPSLWVAVRIERALGIRCASWTEPESATGEDEIRHIESESGHTQDVSGDTAA